MKKKKAKNPSASLSDSVRKATRKKNERSRRDFKLKTDTIEKKERKMTLIQARIKFVENNKKDFDRR